MIHTYSMFGLGQLQSKIKNGFCQKENDRERERKERESEKNMEILNQMGEENEMGKGQKKGILGFWAKKDIWTGRP